MAILAFQKPEKVIMLESTSSFGKFEFRPLEPGFGMTVGNALRRILLSSLEGYAITTVKVAGVDHEFAAIPGVMEDMLNIILRLKQVRFIRTVDNQDAEKVSINVAGVTELTAGYISNYLSFFKVLNPELVICHLAPGTKMQMTLTIGKGRGYVPAEIFASGRDEVVRDARPDVYHERIVAPLPEVRTHDGGKPVGAQRQRGLVFIVDRHRGDSGLQAHHRERQGRQRFFHLARKAHNRRKYPAGEVVLRAKSLQFICLTVIHPHLVDWFLAIECHKLRASVANVYR